MHLVYHSILLLLLFVRFCNIFIFYTSLPVPNCLFNRFVHIFILYLFGLHVQLIVKDLSLLNISFHIVIYKSFLLSGCFLKHSFTYFL